MIVAKQGHEFVGRVEQCDDEAVVGKRVVGEINVCCGDCLECADNNGSHCQKRSVLGIKNCQFGAFAEYLGNCLFYGFASETSPQSPSFSKPSCW